MTVLTQLIQLERRVNAYMIHINYRDPRPIYLQVKEGFRKLVVSGALTAGEKIPSVRELASSLAINPNTIQRAYRELEAEGYISSVPGKGSFVAEFSAAGSARREELLQQMDETVDELLALGIPAEEIIRRIRERGTK